MVGKQRPGKTTRPSLRDGPLQPLQEIITIRFVAENLAPLMAAPDNVMQRPGGIYSSLSWHAPFIAETAEFVNM